MNKARILILNSDRLSQRSLYELLCRSGYVVDIAGSFRQALAYMEENPYRIILADIDKDSSGAELLKVIGERSLPAKLIVLASYGNLNIALSSIKMGALDYLLKPVEDESIIFAVEKALINKTFSDIMPVPVKKISRKEEIFHGLVGNTSLMQEIYSLINRVSDSKATILVRGESGTGKRMIARAIHFADKKRKDKPFIEISCGALPREIIESELFGHTKGSFTGAINDRKGRFELADGGTILLDDIDTFSLDIQVKLLRVLQHKEFERVGDHKTMKVDVRIVVATNQDLERAVSERKFREDLYYRLNVISINVPPLRSRKEDLPLLMNHFIELYSKENHKKMRGISREAAEALIGYNWPGNIRELENIIERAVILDTDSFIDRDDMPEIIFNTITLPKPDKMIGDEQKAANLKDALKEPEKIYIRRILEEVGWNKKKAASKLGVNRTTLYNKLRKYNIFSEVK